MTKCILFN